MIDFSDCCVCTDAHGRSRHEPAASCSQPGTGGGRALGRARRRLHSEALRDVNGLPEKVVWTIS